MNNSVERSTTTKNKRLCSFFYRQSIDESCEEDSSQHSEGSNHKRQNESYDYPEFQRSYTPGLDIPAIVNSIPYECHKFTILTFELHSKYKCEIESDTLTRVITSLYISRQHRDWNMILKTCDKSYLKTNLLELVTGVISPDITGCLEIVVKTSKTNGQVISKGQVLGKIVCRPYLNSSGLALV